MGESGFHRDRVSVCKDKSPEMMLEVLNNNMNVFKAIELYT